MALSGVPTIAYCKFSELQYLYLLEYVVYHSSVLPCILKVHALCTDISLMWDWGKSRSMNSGSHQHALKFALGGLNTVHLRLFSQPTNGTTTP